MQTLSPIQTRKSPFNRWNLIQLNRRDEDPIVDRLLDNPEDPLFLEAKKLLSLKVKRNYIEACLLATNDFDEIEELLEIPADVIEIFKLVFFDIEGFDRLDKLDLLSQCKDPEEAAMKTWALTQGMDFLNWRLGKSPKISPVEALEKVFLDCYFKSREAFYSNNSSQEEKETIRWVKLSMDAARLVKSWVVDSSAAMQDIELALKSVNPTFSTFDDLAKDEEGLTLNITTPEAIFPDLKKNEE